MSTKTLIKVVALSFAALVIMEQITYWFGLQPPFGINPTSSIPIGIYGRTHEALRRGVVIKFPEPHKAGVPIVHPYGIPNLLKYIAAMPGDVVDVTNQGVWINGHLWPNSQPRATTVHPYLGHHVIHPGHVWAMGTNDHSLDSRYFGEVSIASIISTLRPRPLFGIPPNQLCAIKETDPSPSPCYLRN